MKSGSLSRIITVQRAATAVSEAGTPVQTWSDLATLRAELVELGTVEQIKAHGAVDETGIVFRTRFLAGVTNADRVVFDGHPYNLRSVMVIGRNRGLELKVEERA